MSMVPYNKPMFVHVVMNTTSSSMGFQIDHQFGYAIQAVWTGTPTGTFKLQCSCDPVPLGATPVYPQPTNWTDIPTSSQTVSAAGNFTWNVWTTMYNWTRLVYTDASGGTSTATMSAVINTKG